jgi:NADH-quinone oxidoreductase subunit M
MSVVGAVGILLGATYFLWTLQRMFFGTKRFRGGSEWTIQLTDVNAREVSALVPMTVITLVLGILPSLFFSLSNSTLTDLINHTMKMGTSQLQTLTSLLF